MTKHTFARIGILLALALLLVLATAGVAFAWTAAGLRPVSSAEDQFYNYDFTSRTVSATGVDWPVTIIFSTQCALNHRHNSGWLRAWACSSSSRTSNIFCHPRIRRRLVFFTTPQTQTGRSSSPVGKRSKRVRSS